MSKRILDVVVATVALALCTPILALAAIAIVIESRGPVLHKAIRVGRNRAPFTLFKLRSMRLDAAQDGPGITVLGDHRVTRVGRFCRRFKIDELPQLWNVIRGDMSIVGPRPEDQRYLDDYTAEQLKLLDWRPGITSPGSVRFRDEEKVLRELTERGVDLDTAYREVLSIKLGLELDYFPIATVRSDIGWVLRTAVAIVR